MDIEEKDIFVFGSNLAGRHGKGAALHAREKYGAVYGQGFGLQGRSYGIPTKDRNLKVLDLVTIKNYVDVFLNEASSDFCDLTFYVSEIGCGLAGYQPDDIAPFFIERPNNVKLNESFMEVLCKKI